MKRIIDPFKLFFIITLYPSWLPPIWFSSVKLIFIASKLDRSEWFIYWIFLKFLWLICFNWGFRLLLKLVWVWQENEWISPKEWWMQICCGFVSVCRSLIFYFLSYGVYTLKGFEILDRYSRWTTTLLLSMSVNCIFSFLQHVCLLPLISLIYILKKTVDNC